MAHIVGAVSMVPRLVGSARAHGLSSTTTLHVGPLAGDASKMSVVVTSPHCRGNIPLHCRRCRQSTAAAAISHVAASARESRRRDHHCCKARRRRRGAQSASDCSIIVARAGSRSRRARARIVYGAASPSDFRCVHRPPSHLGEFFNFQYLSHTLAATPPPSRALLVCCVFFVASRL